jgi:hypothetical protein
MRFIVRSAARVLVAPMVLSLLAAPALAQAPTAPSKQSEPKLDAEQRQDAQALVTAVDDVMAGKPAPGAVSMKWEQQDFIKAQADKTYVPFTVSFDPATLKSKSIALYLRVVPRGATESAAPADPKKKAESRPQYPFEDLYFFDLGSAGSGAGPAAPAGEGAGAAAQASTEASGRPLVRRAFAVPPGEYDVYVAVKEHAAAPASGASGAAAQSGGASTTAPAEQASPGAIGVLKQPLSVKAFGADEFSTSSIIMAQKVDVLQAPVANERQADNPYTFGQMRIVPSLDHAFSKKSDLNIVFWIYGATPDPNTKKPDVSIDFKFYQKAADKETYFNKTDPQMLNAQTLPPQFDLAAGHQLPGSLSVPLASFPEGEYRLEIEVQDKVANKKLTENVNFNVTAQ